jgi:2-polyprenyl-3-methyl-5-hydroxy-6-metoxy-1,4-benzoquinol methylase
MNTHEEFVERKFKKVSNIIPPNSKILDIGCNDGKIRLFLKNPIYFGIDADEEVISKLINQKINAKKIDLNKDEIPFKNEKFDFVLLLDVLEHVVNPKKLLLNSREKLKPNGKLIITLPNDYHLLNKIRFIFNKHLTEDPFAPHGHLHYFPIKSGEQFILKNNFKIFKKIYLAPVKPRIIPQIIKEFITTLFPQAFSRDTLYVIG